MAYERMNTKFDKPPPPASVVIETATLSNQGSKEWVFIHIGQEQHVQMIFETGPKRQDNFSPAMLKFLLSQRESLSLTSLLLPGPADGHVHQRWRLGTEYNRAWRDHIPWPC